ncbi:MAG: ankyrin repeat domain-containing protein [Stellaceae bacterium]|jgi:ankyrin repeat protein
MSRSVASLLALALLACLPATGARAQSTGSATPFNDTSVGNAPTVPLGGFHTEQPNYIAMSSSANNAGQVMWYVNQHFDPDQPDFGGTTALMYAAINNNAQIAYILISHSSAHVDARDKFGNTALHYAAEHGSLDVLHELLDAKAPIDAQNREGITPLMKAANSGQAAAVKLLLQSGADTSKEDFTGRDALGWAGNKVAVVQLLKNPPGGH